MNYTNERNIPAHIARAIKRHDSKYSKGGADYSATGLIRPAHMAELEAAHRDELTTDVSGAVYRVWGTVAHEVLADGHEDAIQEVRFFADIEYKRGEFVSLSGQVDVITIEHGGLVVLYDTKTTSAGALQAGDVPLECANTGAQYKASADWIAQVNIYRWLAQNGSPADIGKIAGNGAGLVKKIDALRIAVLLRDWNRSRAGQDGYPHAPALDLIVPMWTDSETLDYIKDRIIEHKEPPTECWPEERWERGPSFRVVGPNAPDKNFRSEETAAKGKASADKKGGVHTIELQPGQAARCCPDYCDVWKWCERGGAAK